MKTISFPFPPRKKAHSPPPIASYQRVPSPFPSPYLTPLRIPFFLSLVALKFWPWTPLLSLFQQMKQRLSFPFSVLHVRRIALPLLSPPLRQRGLDHSFPPSVVWTAAPHILFSSLGVGNRPFLNTLGPLPLPPPRVIKTSVFLFSSWAQERIPFFPRKALDVPPSFRMFPFFVACSFFIP